VSQLHVRVLTKIWIQRDGRLLHRRRLIQRIWEPASGRRLPRRRRKTSSIMACQKHRGGPAWQPLAGEGGRRDDEPPRRRGTL